MSGPGPSAAMFDRWATTAGLALAIMGFLAIGRAAPLWWLPVALLGSGVAIVLFERVRRAAMLVVHLFRRVRRLSQLESDLDDARTRLGAAQDAIVELTNRLVVERNFGIAEGIRRAQAAAIAPSLPHPRLLWVGQRPEGLVLYTESTRQDVPVGARFLVIASPTKAALGIVEVTERDDEGGVTLVCIERSDSGFWSALEARDPTDLVAPAGIELATYDLAAHRSDGEDDLRADEE